MTAIATYFAAQHDDLNEPKDAALIAMKLLAIRHGPTDWNDAGRIQGHTDVELSARAASILGVRRVPLASRDWQWFASPLRRARDTASLLGVAAPRIDARLREMHWGEWEGFTREDIAERHGARAVESLRSRGRDFRPPGGETPRELQTRLRAWLDDLAKVPCDSGVVTHKGVIRALLGLAMDWDLHGKPPVKLDWSRAHRFALKVGADGWRLSMDEPNIVLPRIDGGDPHAAVVGW